MSRAGRKAQQQAAVASRRRALWLAGAIGVVALALAIVLVSRPAPVAPLTGDDDPTLGDADARATIYYFADFQCPACRQFELTRLDALKAERIDGGEVKLVFKDMPFIGDDSWTAAEASQHVWSTRPDLYWAWHRGLYEMQGAERSGWASVDRIVAYSERVGLDGEAMRASLESHEHLEEVRADAAEAREHGVASTPTLVIGGRNVRGLDDAAVRDALAEALS